MNIFYVWVFTVVICISAISDSYAQDTSNVSLHPPIVQREIAGHKFWLMPKGDVWGTLDNDQKSFVEKFVKVMKSANIIDLKQMIWPDSIKCLNDAPEALRRIALDSIIDNAMQGDTFSLAFVPYVQVFDPQIAVQLNNWNTDPVPNTHTFLFGFVAKNGLSYTQSHKLIKKGNQYFIILGCPTSNSIELYEDTKSKAEEYYKVLALALAALTMEQRDMLNNLLTKGPEEFAALEYEKMHPQYKEYSKGVAMHLKNELEIHLNEKARLQTDKQKIIPNKEKLELNEPVPSQDVKATVNEEFAGNHMDSFKLIKMASILALIFAVAVLLLRVTRRNDSEQ